MKKGIHFVKLFSALVFIFFFSCMTYSFKKDVHSLSGDSESNLVSSSKDSLGVELNQDTQKKGGGMVSVTTSPEASHSGEKTQRTKKEISAIIQPSNQQNIGSTTSTIILGNYSIISSQKNSNKLHPSTKKPEIQYNAPLITGTGFSSSQNKNVSLESASNLTTLYRNNLPQFLAKVRSDNNPQTILPLSISPTVIYTPGTGKFSTTIVKAAINIAADWEIIITDRTFLPLFSTKELSAKQISLEWNGKTSHGKNVKPGVYHVFAVASNRATNEVVAVCKDLLLSPMVALATPTVSFVEKSHYADFVTNLDSIPLKWIEDGDTLTGYERFEKEGLYIIKRSVARSNETVTDSIKILVDRTPPTIMIKTPESGFTTNKSTITITWHISDSGDSINKDTTDIAKLEKGTNHIIRTYKDRAGNVGNDTVLFTLDTDSPIVHILSPDNGFITNKKEIGVLWSVDGSLQNLLTSEILRSDSNWIVRGVKDSAGNIGIDSTLVILDTIPPKVVIISPLSNSYSKTSSTKVIWQIDGQIQPTQILEELTQDTNRIVRKYIDAAGNVGSDSILVFLDTIAPSLAFIFPGNDTLINHTDVTVRWLENGNTKSLDTTLCEGMNFIARTTKDAAGNTAQIARKITVDIQAPVVTILSPMNGTALNKPVIDLVWLIDGNKQSAQISENLIEGTNTITRIAMDAAGNVGTASIVVSLDTKVPIITINSPANESITNNPIATVVWAVDGNIQTAQTTENLIEGVNTITRTFTDAAGNTGTAACTITLDSKAPVVAITSPANGTITNNPITSVTWTVDGINQTVQTTERLAEGVNTLSRTYTDVAGNIGSKSVQITLDTKAPLIAIIVPENNFLTNNPKVHWVWTIDGIVASTDTLLTNGKHILTKSAVDSAGNSSTASVTVTVDDVAPTVKIISPENGFKTKKPLIHFVWSIDSVLDSTDVLMPVGQQTLTKSIKDSAGNIGSDQISVFIGNSPPRGTDDAKVADNDMPLLMDDLLKNDTDPDGDTLAITYFSKPEHGTLTFNGATSLSYLATYNYVGPDSFTYVVSDNCGGNDTAKVRITVAALNNPPVVGIIYPQPKDKFTAPVPRLTIRAEAVDYDGTLKRVDLYKNGTFLATLTKPYHYTDTNVVKGRYTYKVIAIDDDSARTESYPVEINVIDALFKNPLIVDPVTDISLGGNGAVRDFVRFYSHQSEYNGPLGKGWSHLYNIQLKKLDETKICIYDYDHQNYFYYLQADGSFSDQSQICHCVKKYDRTLSSTANNTYTLETLTKTKYVFTADGNLQKITTANGNSITFQYAQGLLRQIANDAGNSLTFDYFLGPVSLIRSITDSYGSYVQFDYSGDNLVQVIDLGGNTTRYRYDRKGLAAIEATGSGAMLYNVDDNGLITRKMRSDGAFDNTLNYDPDKKWYSLTDAVGNTTVYYYDEMQNITGILKPDGNIERYKYDANGFMVSKIESHRR